VDQVKMMKDSNWWPNWPLLPLKRREKSPGVGTLIDQMGPVVWCANTSCDADIIWADSEDAIRRVY
jgi:hypothetical protein